MTIHIPTLNDIPTAARQFVQALDGRSIFAFYAPMGTGKTTFIKAICHELGVTDAVASPTFAIVNEYADREGNPIYHFDFYRIRRTEEVLDLGFDDYMNSGHLCLMEWPELIEPLLPEDTVTVRMSEQPDGSRLVEF